MKSEMILRTVLLTAWLGFAPSFGAAAQNSGAAAPTVNIGETGAGGDNDNGNLLLPQEATLSQSATIKSLPFYVTSASGKLVLDAVRN